MPHGALGAWHPWPPHRAADAVCAISMHKVDIDSFVPLMEIDDVKILRFASSGSGAQNLWLP